MNHRVDGYPSHEDAAAGYETWVGIFRMAMRDARTAIDAGLPAQAAQILADAETDYENADRARQEAHRPAMRAAGLDYAPDGTVVLAAGAGYGSDTGEHGPSGPDGRLKAEGPAMSTGGAPRTRCPDGGTCHHDCPQTSRGGGFGFPCARVLGSGPLSGVFPGDRWPEPQVPAVGSLLLQPRGALAVALLNEGTVKAGVLRRADELLAGRGPLPDGIAGRLRAMADAGNPGAAQVLARQEEA